MRGPQDLPTSGFPQTVLLALNVWTELTFYRKTNKFQSRIHFMVLDPGVLGYLEPRAIWRVLAIECMFLSRGSVPGGTFCSRPQNWAGPEVLTHVACSPTEREGSAAPCWSELNLLFF